MMTTWDLKHHHHKHTLKWGKNHMFYILNILTQYDKLKSAWNFI